MLADGQDFESVLKRHGLATAAVHLHHAEADFGEGRWEACNAQLRSFVEAVFDGVAHARLEIAVKGGAARLQLQNAGVLEKRFGALVKSFMDWAGTAGSHPGVSSEFETGARRNIALALGSLALELLPKIVRVEDVFRRAGISPLRADADLHTRCPTCGTTQSLSEAEVTQADSETVYTCRNGCQPIVIVGPPGDSQWPGRGYRLGDYVIRNPSDLFLPIGELGVVMPGSGAALMTRRPAG